MQPLDGFYLYKVGGALKPLEKINAELHWGLAWLPLAIAHNELEKFVDQSVYKASVRSSRPFATALLAILKNGTEDAGKEDNRDKELGPWRAYEITNALREFETAAAAEFGLTPMFLVTPKRAYDLPTLVNFGAALFPNTIYNKVPAAVVDLQAGVRCMAFELNTAAAFHFHRATESVLRTYWEVVRPGAKHPGNKTIGDYLTALRISRKGSPKIKASLRDIKDLYRNPVIHPEYQVKDTDECIALLNTIHTAIVLMLDVIPTPASPPATAAP